MIKKGSLTLPESMSGSAKNLLRSLLAKQPTNRLDFNAVIEHDADSTARVVQTSDSLTANQWPDDLEAVTRGGRPANGLGLAFSLPITNLFEPESRAI